MGTSENFKSRDLIYKNWSLENFKDLFLIITGHPMPVTISNFIYGYTSVLDNKQKMEDTFGYKDFSYTAYYENIARLYASNIEKFMAIDPQFSKIFQKDDGTYLLQDLKIAIQKDSTFFHFLTKLEENSLCVYKGGFTKILCHITQRYISYYHTENTHFMSLKDVELSLEKVLRECHQETKCAFSFDYGWDSIEDWLSLVDSGKMQLCSNSAIMTNGLYFSDCIVALLNQKAHLRNKRAIAILRNANEDLKGFSERIEANLEFMKHIEATNTFKKLIDSSRSNFKK